MRVVQLSDIHLSKDNLGDWENYYLQALLEDLKKFSDDKPIDIVLFTGDLVDKGGESLGTDPYHVFQNEIITPIIKSINLSSEQVLIIPGNHDINRLEVEKFSEAGLSATLDSSSANDSLLTTKVRFTPLNKRMERFKSFESEFQKTNSNYTYSPNESAYIYEENGRKVGFALINDSWRCSATLTREQHFIGYNQLLQTEQIFAKTAPF